MNKSLLTCWKNIGIIRRSPDLFHEFPEKCYTLCLWFYLSLRFNLFFFTWPNLWSFPPIIPPPSLAKKVYHNFCLEFPFVSDSLTFPCSWALRSLIFVNPERRRQKMLIHTFHITRCRIPLKYIPNNVFFLQLNLFRIALQYKSIDSTEKASCWSTSIKKKL
jgi:hypothetical protein